MKSTVYLLSVLLCGALLTPAPAQTFSVDLGGFTPIPPDDLLAPGPVPMLPGFGGAPIEVDALSYGYDLRVTPPPVGYYFSVDRRAIGAPGTAVNIESAFGILDADQSADIYLSFGAGSNIQVADGNGLPPVGVITLGLSEPGTGLGGPGPSDNLDALDMRMIGAAPPVGPGVFFSVDAFSASTFYGGLGLTGADVFVSPLVPGYDAPVPALYAPFGVLGLLPTDEIDALVVLEGDGDGLFSPGIDSVVFSLAPGSPSLGGLGATPGDILINGVGGALPSIVVSFAALGLTPQDNLNALDVHHDIIPEPATGLFLAGGLFLAYRWRKRTR